MTQDELCNGIDATMAAIVARSGDELLDSIAVSFLRNLRKECCDDVQLCIHCKLAPAQFCPVKGFYGCRTAAGVTGAPAARRGVFGWRKCEFCGCNTNARFRACCEKGKAADGVTGTPHQTNSQDTPIGGNDVE